MLPWLVEQERKQLQRGKIPEHVAIIMDGNGTWANRRGLPRNAGHAKGADALKRTIEESLILGIKHLSVYAFSTENWKRPKAEIDYLMGLFVKSLEKETPKLIENKILVDFLGDRKAFSKELQTSMYAAEKATSQFPPKLNLHVMINYGARAEILQAVNKLIASGKPLATEDEFGDWLYTAELPDPDLLIRTSGQLRVSNFMLWQIAYSEFWITPICWPDFSGATLRQAVKSYQHRQRRKGGL